MPAPTFVPPQYQSSKYYTQDPDGKYYTVVYNANKDPQYFWEAAAAGWGPGRGFTQVAWTKAYPQSVGGGPLDLGVLNKTTRPAESSTWRYPMAGNGQGGIQSDGDYVMFQFYNYIPPFGADRVANSASAFDYNMATEYNEAQQASSYKPILLYMPEDLSTGFRANWDGKSMSNLAAGALRTFGQKGLGNKATAGANAINQLFQRSGALFGAAAVKSATTRLGGDALSYDDIFGGISGGIMNPNTELLFGGVQMRNFQLNFKLVPRHGQEAIQVNEIVKQFKRAMLPTSQPGEIMGFNRKANNIGVTLGFIGVPKLVRVSFMKGSNEHEGLPRYKMCALTSVDANYTPDGTYATYQDGQPVAIGLSLNFQETKICYSEDISSNNVR